MDIELTSARQDRFTWRAAGARQPKGVVESSLLPAGAKVGDVVRVEAEVEIDGITILSVLPSKEKAPAAGRIEVIGTAGPAPGVTAVLAGRSDRKPASRRERDDGEHRDHRGSDRETRRPRSTAQGERRGRPSTAGDRGARPRPTSSAREQPDAGARPADGRVGERATGWVGERATGRVGERATARATDRRNGERPSFGGAGAGGPGRARRPAARDERGPAPRGSDGSRGPAPRRGPVRLEPGTRHRDELLERLSPEERTIAGRLATDGLPGLRRAIAEEQARARSEGRPPVSGDPLIAMAERLLPDVQSASWLDRAEAAADKIDELSLRDLRTTVAGAAPRDEVGRQLERRLREGLEKRVTKLRTDWEEHLKRALDDGRVLQALRLSGRPPEPTARFPAALVQPLVAQSSAAMTAETSPERWLSLLEAAIASPVRRQIKPNGIPKAENGAVEQRARLAAGRIPALAPLLGMAMPPPPQPLPGERAARLVHSRFPPRPPRPPRSLREPRPPGSPLPGPGQAAGPPGAAQAPVPIPEAGSETTPGTGPEPAAPSSGPATASGLGVRAEAVLEEPVEQSGDKG